jgi:RNA polymerase sigma-70 factor, ECF subfamily
VAGGDWFEALHQIERGDRVALARVTALITGYLSRFGAYRIRDSWQDLCQEVLIKLIRSAREGRIQEPAAFVGYAGSITRNSLADWYRRNARHEATGGADDPLSDDAALARAGLVCDPKPDLRADLQGALETLPEVQRRVVAAVYVDGLTYEEAAGVLGLPLGTLKRHQTEGLKALRGHLGIGGPG